MYTVGLTVICTYLFNFSFIRLAPDRGLTGKKETETDGEEHRDLHDENETGNLL
jgi:hypothetical protein